MSLWPGVWKYVFVCSPQVFAWTLFTCSIDGQKDLKIPLCNLLPIIAITFHWVISVLKMYNEMGAVKQLLV